jgi:alkanesulfonate monooxygenase SsuD/methylene tetrahydromethanopterin reductase-like flavin-dependent oxidoreductase (luciferase family)
MRDKLETFAVGCLLDTNFGPFHQPEPDREFVNRHVLQLIEEGVEAEEAGFEGVFVPESHMRTETVFPDPLLLLAILASRTRRVRLASYALIPAYGWNPMHLAEATAMVDQVSGGRFTLVVAQGLVEESFRMFGVDSRTRLSIFTESIEVIQKAWTSSQPFSFHGKRFRFDDVFLTPKPYQRDPHPTLWGGGLREAGVRRAGSYATGWCSSPFPMPLPAWKGLCAVFRDEARRHGVENPKVILMRDGFVAETRREAEQVAEAAFMPEWLEYFDAGVLSLFDPRIQSRADVTLRKMREHLVLGTPADCVEALQRCRQEYEADYVVLRFRCAWGPEREATRRCMRLFGESVLPRVVPAGTTPPAQGH